MFIAFTQVFTLLRNEVSTTCVKQVGPSVNARALSAWPHPLTQVVLTSYRRLSEQAAVGL